jgi:3-hydroxyacyl-CoA dehydrogenase
MRSLQEGAAVVGLNSSLVGDARWLDLMQQIEAAQQHVDVRAIVLDLGPESSRAPQNADPSDTPNLHLSALIGRIEASRQPVVAALSGIVSGPVVELALACQSRVALNSTRIGFPSIALGLIPSSGATQRLPRLVGIELAQAMLMQGDTRTAEKLGGTGLLDEVVNADVVGAGVRQALRLTDGQTALGRVRDRTLDKEAVERAVGSQRAKLTPRQRLQPAYAALLDALSASALPLEQGLDREHALATELASSVAAQALRYQLEAERAAVRYVAGPDTAPRAVRSVCVIGAGTMGTGIAIAALDAGLAVRLLEQDASALERGRQRIADHYRQRVDAGKVTTEHAVATEQRLQTTIDWSGLASADLVIEAVFEDMAVKQEVFRKIDRYARPGAVLASNTSYLDLDAIAGSTSRPADVVGLHFFSPANVMKLLEVVRGSHTSADVIATAMAVGAALGKVPVQCGNAFGFIGNRIYNAYRKQCEFMLEDGALPEQVDGALTAMGFAMGPFAVADLSGLDIAWRMRKAQAASRDPRERYVDILDRLCEQGRLGRKSGAGYYTYEAGKASATSDATVRQIVEQASAQRGIVRRPIAPAEIQRRALLAMVNEAASVVAEGIASRPGDVDVVMAQGYGFPRWEGGPVFWARRQDRAALEADLMRMASEAGPGFVLADLSPLLPQ